MKYGAIVAFKVEEKGGKLQLDAGLDLARHEPRRAAGDRQRRGLRLRQRRGHRPGVPDVGLDDIARSAAFPGSTHAVLYALDAQTGKELWSSGNQITSWNHWSGLSVANGRVYIATFDGTSLLLRNQEVERMLAYCTACSRLVMRPPWRRRRRNRRRMLLDWAGLTRYGSENAELRPPKPGENRVVFLGDQITENWPADDVLPRQAVPQSRHRQADQRRRCWSASART